MAGDWIKIRSNIKDDPDVVLMAMRLETDEFTVVGRLHAVWAWLDQHSKDGTNVRITSAYLDRLTACLGFADAMRAVGWLDGRDGALDFPNFERHNGESAKVRASDSKRKQRQREAEEERDKCPKDGGTESGTNVRKNPDQRREEKSRANTGERENAGEPLAESVEEIVKAYPRRDDPMECRRLVMLCLSNGDDPLTMLAQVKQCASHISKWPQGHGNGMVPKARNFFSREEWRSPEAYASPPRSRATAGSATMPHQQDKPPGNGWGTGETEAPWVKP